MLVPFVGVTTADTVLCTVQNMGSSAAAASHFGATCLSADEITIIAYNGNGTVATGFNASINFSILIVQNFTVVAVS